MSHSYSSNRIHLVFSTKKRERRIKEELQIKLWPYMAGIARNHGFEAVKVGGVEDHAHVLMILPPTIPLAKAIQTHPSGTRGPTSVTQDFRPGLSWVVPPDHKSQAI